MMVCAMRKIAENIQSDFFLVQIICCISQIRILYFDFSNVHVYFFFFLMCLLNCKTRENMSFIRTYAELVGRVLS